MRKLMKSSRSMIARDSINFLDPCKKAPQYALFRSPSASSRNPPDRECQDCGKGKCLGKQTGIKGEGEPLELTVCTTDEVNLFLEVIGNDRLVPVPGE